MKQLSVMLIVLLLFSWMLPTAAAANSAQSTMMRLVSIEGDVTLKNGSNKEIPATKGMNLFNGYSLSTGAASYAYISLDSSKAIKLDALSSTTIKKKGKKLEILITAGKVFFNVTAPLKSNETMEIRTSTMVTGIRGTSGYGEQLSNDSSRLTLLSGHVTIESYNADSAQIEAVTIAAGQTATVEQQQVKQAGVIVAPLDPEHIDGFVLKEIARDPMLQEQIKAQSKLDLRSVVSEADQRLQQEQIQQKELQDHAQRVQKQQSARVVDTRQVTDNRSAASGSSSNAAMDTSVTPSPSADADPVTVPNPAPVNPDPIVTPDPAPVAPDPVVTPDPAPVAPDPVVTPDPAPVAPDPVVPPDPAAVAPDPVVTPDPSVVAPDPVVPPDPAPVAPVPVVPPAPTDTIVIDDVTKVHDIQDALNTYNHVILDFKNSYTLAKTLTIPNGKTLSLLNGTMLWLDVNGSLTNEARLEIERGAVLQLNGSSSIHVLADTKMINYGKIASLADSEMIIEQKGYFNNRGDISLAGNLQIYGYLLMEEGKIDATTSEGEVGIYDGGSMEMTGGKISGVMNAVNIMGGSMKLTGGEICDAKIGVYLTKSTNTGDISTLTMEHGSSISAQNIGVQLMAGATMTMEGGTIRGGNKGISVSSANLNITDSDEITGSIAGVDISGSSSVVNMAGGTISSEGNGATVSGGLFALAGGTIKTLNESKIGVYLVGNGNLAMTGGLISTRGTGVSVNSGTFTLAGGTIETFSRSNTVYAIELNDIKSFVSSGSSFFVSSYVSSNVISILPPGYTISDQGPADDRYYLTQ